MSEFVINVVPDPSTVIDISSLDQAVSLDISQNQPNSIIIEDDVNNVLLNPSVFYNGINIVYLSGVSGELLHNTFGDLQGGTTGQYYHLTSGEYFNLTTGAVVRPSETGNFITASQTGAFYPASNPSGFITGVDLSNYATIPYTTGISGGLQTQINNTNQILSTAVFVTGNQDISGLKDFQTRPTVLDIPVLVSGDAVDTIHLYGKNDQGTTIYKGQPVYIGGANGANALIQLASNTGERTSSKTIGLLAQDIPVNEFGYVITEGLLEGFNTSAGIAGDPMWLGTFGNIIYGTGNKPYGNNHLVSLGIVLRSNNNNGKVYVKVQNGFEIEELHKVYAINPSNKDTLLYNSGSGAWFARQLNTGDVSGISNYVLNSATGVFYPASNPSGFITGLNQVSFLTLLPTGIEETGISFPYSFATIPKVLNELQLNSNTGYLVGVKNVAVTGYTAIFSDILTETGIYLHTFAIN